MNMQTNVNYYALAYVSCYLSVEFDILMDNLSALIAYSPTMPDAN